MKKKKIGVYFFMIFQLLEINEKKNNNNKLFLCRTVFGLLLKLYCEKESFCIARLRLYCKERLDCIAA